MTLTNAAFALAGLLAAAGPVIIHLLNRRRYRTVEWGAMSFLRKAMHRTRRSVRLRDLLLLLLRTAAILFFGLALARPFYSSQGLPNGRLAVIVIATVAILGGLIGASLSRTRLRRLVGAAFSIAGIAVLIGVLSSTAGGSAVAVAASSASSREPVHAIFVIDNSRSMGVNSIAGSLLDAAKQRVDTALRNLPAGSRVSILPLCGPEQTYTLDAHRHTEDARAALERIQQTDSAGSVLTAFSLAADAAARVPDIASHRAVFLSDQQASGWPASGVAEAFRSTKLPLQFVEVGEPQYSEGSANLWIESFAVQDGLAEAGLPTTFLARLRCEGPRPVNNVDLTLEIDGQTVASQTVDLRPAQSREITFTTTADIEIEAGDSRFLSATLTLRTSESDTNQLERDDSRHLVFPVVAAVPVVFIDDVGEQEDLDLGRVGETYRLRRLLAPRPAEGVYAPFVAVRHITLNELDQQTLEEARLVVIAGVEAPTEDAVRQLRQYVEQGGPVVIAAGASFDSARWNAIAWNEGLGILPLPLADVPVGIRPSQAVASSKIEPFRLETSSLDHPFFSIPGEKADALTRLWNGPLFFQAVQAMASNAAIASAVEQETSRIDAEQKAIAAGTASAAEMAPGWLVWKNQARAMFGDNPDAPRPEGGSAAELAAQAAPRVLARFTREDASGVALPYLIERRIGYGRVLLMTAGISSDWDTLSQTNAILLLDRITRTLIEDNLPRRMFEAGDSIALPVDRRPDSEHRLLLPNGNVVPLGVDATGRGYLLRVNDTSSAGTYRVTTTRNGEASGIDSTLELALNGPERESNLRRLTAKEMAERAGDADITFVAHDESFSLTGEPTGGATLWKWLVLIVLVSLVAEMGVAGFNPRKVAEVST